MSFFKPEDFEKYDSHTFDVRSQELACLMANAKRDEALEEAEKLISKFHDEQSNALQSIAFDPRPNRENMLRAKEWLKKYGGL